MWLRRYSREQADRQTDTQTYSSQYFATAPVGEVKNESLKAAWPGASFSLSAGSLYESAPNWIQFSQQVSSIYCIIRSGFSELLNTGTIRGSRPQHDRNFWKIYFKRDELDTFLFFFSRQLFRVWFNTYECLFRRHCISNNSVIIIWIIFVIKKI